MDKLDKMKTEDRVKTEDCIIDQTKNKYEMEIKKINTKETSKTFIDDIKHIIQLRRIHNDFKSEVRWINVRINEQKINVKIEMYNEELKGFMGYICWFIATSLITFIFCIMMANDPLWVIAILLVLILLK
jgi:hypothetical protein